jgi:ABC-type Na+ transport system ATPase subunit NatA
MDATTLLGVIQGLLVALWGIITWAHLDVKKKTEKAVDDLNKFKIHCAEKYVTQEDHRRTVTSITDAFKEYGNKLDERFDRLEQKLDRKVDK